MVLKPNKRYLALGIALLVGFLAPAFGASAQVSGCELPLEGDFAVTNGPGEGFHHGASEEAIDLRAPSDTPVYPCKPGKIVFAGWDSSGFGYLVKVLHGDATTSYYAHLKSGSISVKVGQVVGYTTKLGEVDCTGDKCTGNHLHFEVRDKDGKPVSVRDLVNWNPGCPPCAGDSGTASGDPRYLFVADSFFLETGNGSASSSTTLSNGQSYLITIAGTFSHWAAPLWGQWTGSNASNICEGRAERGPLVSTLGKINGPVGGDPEYLFAYPIYFLPGRGNTCKTGFNSIARSASTQLSVDGGATFVNTQPTNTALNPGHSYQYLVNGRGHTLRVKLVDSYYPDNYGQLVINIERN